MLRSSTLALGLSTVVLAGALVGCGRLPAAMPGAEEPAAPPAPTAAPATPAPGGPTPPPAPPAPGPGPVQPPAPPAPPAAPGLPPLAPLPKPTPTPGLRPAAAPAPVDPAAAMEAFLELLGKFGYEAGGDAAHNIKMQIGPVLRVPANRFHLVDGPGLKAVYEARKASFGANPPDYATWMAGAKAAAQAPAKGWFVGRRALYRSILRDRYTELGSDRELIFYRRLPDTRMVSYRADGRIDDYGVFPDTTWRDFLAVPAALMR